MTALGLAVTIPAVLAYNNIVRNNRRLVGQIEHFAYELHTPLVPGAVIHVKPNVNSKENTQQKERVHAVEVPA